MKRTFGVILLIIIVAAIIIGMIQIIDFCMFDCSESVFLTGFVMVIVSIFVGDEVIPLFFEEWYDEDEDE